MTNKFLCAALTGAILALAPLSSAVAGEHSWTEARPSGGVATQLVHTSDGLYMVSGARVYLSENDGTTWALHATLPSDIIALATPAATPAVLVAATVADGIQRSTDGGATWTQAADVDAVGFDAHPTDSARLYAAVPGTGVMTSANGGASWAAVTAQPASLEVVDVTVDPIAPAVLYAGTADAGVFRSANAGGLWAPASVGLSLAESYDRVYASPHADAGGTRSKVLLAGSTSAPTVYRSDDEGANWTAITSDLPPPGSGMALQQLQFDPDPRFMNGMYMTFKGANVAFPDTFFKSSDADASTGGVNWVARPHPDGATIGPDMHALYVSPENLGRIVVGTDRGNYMSFDLGMAWEAFNDGFGNTIVVDVAVGEALYAASREGGVLMSTDGGDEWTSKNAGLASTDVTAVAADSERVIAAQADGAFQVSVDDGDTWVPAADGDLELVSAIRFGADADTVFALDDARNGVFKSTDGGQTWTFSGSGMPADAGEGDQTQLAPAPSDAAIIYVGTGAGVYRSTNGGTSWAARLGGLAATQVTALAVDPDDADLVYAAFDGDAYVSDDGGASWSPAWAGTGAATDVRAIAIDAADPDRMLVATDAGVFGSIDAGASWHDLSEGYATDGGAAVAVDGLAFGAASGGHFVVAADEVVQTYEGAIASDLVASATTTDTAVDVGDTVTVEFALANVAGHDAKGAEVAFDFPSALVYDSISLSGASCAFATGSVTCPVGDLAVGESVSGTITLDANSAATAEITVTGSSAERENKASDNSVKVTSTVGTGSDDDDDDDDDNPPGPPPPGDGNDSGGGGGNGGLPWLAGLLVLLAVRRKGYSM